MFNSSSILRILSSASLRISIGDWAIKYSLYDNNENNNPKQVIQVQDYFGSEGSPARLSISSIACSRVVLSARLLLAIRIRVARAILAPFLMAASRLTSFDETIK